MKKRKIRAELLAIAALLLLCFAVLAVRYFTREAGGSVLVRLDGEELCRLSLSDEGRYELNGGSNVLVIAEGSACMVQADCPDKYCIKQGRIAFEGQCIVCLPNRLSITVEGVYAGIDAVG